MSGAVGTSAAQALAAFPHGRIEGVDFERILPRQERLQFEDLLLCADSGSAVRFGDAVSAVVRGDFYQHIGTRARERHTLHVTDFVPALLRSGQKVKPGQEWCGCKGAGKAAAGNHITRAPSFCESIQSWRRVAAGPLPETSCPSFRVAWERTGWRP